MPSGGKYFSTCWIKSFLPRVERLNFGWKVGGVASHDDQVVEQCRGGEQTVKHGVSCAERKKLRAIAYQ